MKRYSCGSFNSGTRYALNNHRFNRISSYRGGTRL